MKVTSTLYGVKFQANPALPVWQPDVRGYDVMDGKTGKYLSSFYLDLFPRDGKFKHAAAFPVRGVSMAVGRTPVCVLVTNFSREGFDQDELRYAVPRVRPHHARRLVQDPLCAQRRNRCEA